MADPLRDELLAVPGITGAEVDQDRGVAGVRVQLAAGADAEAVGHAVRRILVEHGMRPAPGEGEENAEQGPPPPPGAPGSVVSFPLVGEHAVNRPDETAQPRLESVAVEETRNGISVLVRNTDGVHAVRTLDTSGMGMDEAVAGAVGELTGRAGVALVGVADAELGGSKVVTVVLAQGERRVSGSSVQRGGRAYAVARAVWTALETP